MNRSTVRRRPIMVRLGIGAIVGVVGALAIASSASAHVKVSGVDTTQGGYGMVTFRVPTESDSASTTGVTVTFPESARVLSADTQPIAGWKAKVVTKKLATPVKTDDGTVDTAVAKIEWTADSASDGIAPGEFQLFNASVGPLPKQSSVRFPVLQRYSDGTTVNWNESADGGAEPEHPAAVLQLGDSSSVTASAEPTAEAVTADHAAASWPGVVGMIAGCVALIVALAALIRSFRRSGHAETSRDS